MSKLTTLFLTLIMFCAVDMTAQDNGRFRYKRSAKSFDIKFGVMAGMNRSWFEGDKFVARENVIGNDFESFTKFKGRYSYHVGVYADLKFNNSDFLQLDVRWANKAWKQEGPYSFSPFSPTIGLSPNLNRVEVLANITYIEIPIRYKRRLFEYTYVLLGPYFGVNTNETYLISNDFGQELPDSDIASTYYSGMNYGINLGFNYQSKNGLLVAVEYQHGLKDLNNYTGITQVPIPRNHIVTASISVGYTFMYHQRYTNYRRRSRGLL